MFDQWVVSVMLQPFEFDPSEKTKHKFMIQSMIVQAEAEESELVSDRECTFPSSAYVCSSL